MPTCIQAIFSLNPAGVTLPLISASSALSHKPTNVISRRTCSLFNRDYYRVAELHVESGWVPRNTRVDEFESAIRSVCEPIFNKPLSEISFWSFSGPSVPDCAPLSWRSNPSLLLQRRCCTSRDLVVSSTGTRSLDHRKAVPRTLDGRAGRPKGVLPQTAEESSENGRTCSGHAAAAAQSAERCRRASAR